MGINSSTRLAIALLGINFTPASACAAALCRMEDVRIIRVYQDEKPVTVRDIIPKIPPLPVNALAFHNEPPLKSYFGHTKVNKGQKNRPQWAPKRFNQ